MEYPKTLIAALDKLNRLGRAAEWPEFAIVIGKNGVVANTFRHLKRRRWIEDDGSCKPYRDGEPYTGPRSTKYVMTDAGRTALNEGREP